MDNRLHRGFGAGPALGNLDGSADGSLEIVIGANDRHVYAWHNDGTAVTGWPALLKDPAKVQSVDPVSNEITLTPNARAKIGTKIIAPASLGDIDGDGRLDVVVGVNEEYGEKPNTIFTNLTINLYRAAGVLESGNGRVYALFADGTAHGPQPIVRGWNPDAFMPGWPVKVAILQLELLPTVGSGINGPPALADLDHDGRAEVAVFSYIGPAYVFDGLGRSFLGDAQGGVPRTLEVDTFGAQSNSVDAPAIPALGGGVLAEMAGPAGGVQFVAPTAGLGKLIDSNLAARQTPADNQLAVWDLATADGKVGSGEFRPAFPRVVNDLQFLTAPSVADIDGDGLPEALEGSGVYDLHAINVHGVEPPGWPKLTGGWVVATPAVGDIDGDGQLDVVTLTREGALLIWSTPAGECSPAPWRKAHHDEWNTGNYDTDARLPAPLLVGTASVSGGGRGRIDLALSAVPGDNLYCGAASDIDARYAAQPIESEAAFAAATSLQLVDGAATACRHCSATLQLQATPPYTAGLVHVAARTIDAAGNRSPITSVGQVVLSAEPTPTTSATPTPSPTTTRSATPSPTANVLAPRNDNGGCSTGTGSHDLAGGWAWLALALGLLLRRSR